MALEETRNQESDLRIVVYDENMPMIFSYDLDWILVHLSLGFPEQACLYGAASSLTATAQ